MLLKVILSILLLIPSYAAAMESEIFHDMIKNIHEKKYTPVEEFLEKNRSRYERNPEFYVILLNYSFSKGSQNQIVVAKGEPKPGDLELRDKDTGEVVGFMGNRNNKNTEMVIKGITETQNAQSFFNNRLDIHFGIIHIASLIERWDIVGSQLIKILKISKTNNNEWTWGAINTMDGDPKQFMLENVQARVNQLFHARSEQADQALEAVSEAMIKEYPNVIYGYSNLGVFYLVNGKYDFAEKYLNQAIAIDPKDEIVQGNLSILKEKMAQ